MELSAEKGSRPPVELVEEKAEPQPPVKTPLPPRRAYTSPLDGSYSAYFVGLAVILLASAATRLYSISRPDHIA